MMPIRPPTRAQAKAPPPARTEAPPKAAAKAPARRAPPETTMPPITQGEGSGAYMRRLMGLGFEDAEVILDSVHRQFPGSKATKSDVAFNRSKFRKDGMAPVVDTSRPTVVGTARDAKYSVAVKIPKQDELPWEAPPGKKGAKVPASGEEGLPYATLRGKVWALRGRADRETTTALVTVVMATLDALEKLAP